MTFSQGKGTFFMGGNFARSSKGLLKYGYKPAEFFLPLL